MPFGPRWCGKALYGYVLSGRDGVLGRSAVAVTLDGKIFCFEMEQKERASRGLFWRFSTLLKFSVWVTRVLEKALLMQHVEARAKIAYYLC